MDKNIAQHKATREYTEQDTQYKITATIELHAIGEQSPYFAMTVDIMEHRRNINGHFTGRWRHAGGGAAHDILAKRFPEYKKYLKWHLCSIQTGPMHYIPNALYWAGYCGWHGKTPNIEYLKSTIVYGVLSEDNGVDLESLIQCDKDVFGTWLLNRYDALMQTFRNDMVDLFGPALADVLENEYPIQEPYIGKYLKVD